MDNLSLCNYSESFYNFHIPQMERTISNNWIKNNIIIFSLPSNVNLTVRISFSQKDTIRKNAFNNLWTQSENAFDSVENSHLYLWIRFSTAEYSRFLFGVRNFEVCPTQMCPTGRPSGIRSALCGKFKWVFGQAPESSLLDLAISSINHEWRRRSPTKQTLRRSHWSSLFSLWQGNISHDQRFLIGPQEGRHSFRKWMFKKCVKLNYVGGSRK